VGYEQKGFCMPKKMKITHEVMKNMINECAGLFEGKALQMVRTRPKWLPARCNGSPAKVLFRLPVRFELK